MSERITINPAQCGGKPCVRGMRIRVIDVVGLARRGMSAEAIVTQLPCLELAEVAASVEYASKHELKGDNGTNEGSE